MNKVIKCFIYLLLAGASSTSWGVPEAARYGYFQCVSCHVSPGGSGLLTAYGRSFSAERLTTWKYKNEENPLHGALPNSETILVGGDIRSVHLRTKKGDEPYIKTWRMQADGDLGVHLGPVWLSVTGGAEPSGPEENPEAKKGILLRSFAARIDLLDDHLLIRAGKFTPRFGLGLIDHTAFVRAGVGLWADGEQNQAEVIVQSEMFEVGVAVLAKKEGSDRAVDRRTGFASQASTFLMSQHRINVNWMRFVENESSYKSTRDAMGLSGVLTLTKMFWAMLEFDRVHDDQKYGSIASLQDMMITYESFHGEWFQGLESYLRHEHIDVDITKKNTSTNRYSVGSVWRPRPHISLDARVSRTFDNQSETTRDQIEAIAHYYL